MSTTSPTITIIDTLRHTRSVVVSNKNFATLSCYQALTKELTGERHQWSLSNNSSPAGGTNNGFEWGNWCSNQYDTTHNYEYSVSRYVQTRTNTNGVDGMICSLELVLDSVTGQPTGIYLAMDEVAQDKRTRITAQPLYIDSTTTTKTLTAQVNAYYLSMIYDYQLAACELTVLPSHLDEDYLKTSYLPTISDHFYDEKSSSLSSLLTLPFGTSYQPYDGLYKYEMVVTADTSSDPQLPDWRLYTVSLGDYANSLLNEYAFEDSAA